MQSSNSKNRIWSAAKNAAVFFGLGMLVYNGVNGIFFAPTTTVHAQNDAFLSRRVDMLEQRLYSMESKISQLSMQSRPSVLPSVPITTQNDINYLQTSVDGVRVRIGELECAVLKLDERTLTAAQRRTTKTGSTADRCRESFGSPIQLSARP